MSTPADESQTYEAETMYATYGHWLTANTSDTDLWDVKTIAYSGGGTTVNLAAGTEANNLEDKATYSGSAVGISSQTAGSGDSMTTDSGQFTADVTLNASFGTAPTVRGTINNFVGDAIDSGWSVTLESATLGTSLARGRAVATGADGAWSAQAYGNDADERPAGIFGGFSAHFTDGDAAGGPTPRARIDAVRNSMKPRMGGLAPPLLFLAAHGSRRPPPKEADFLACGRRTSPHKPTPAETPCRRLAAPICGHCEPVALGARTGHKE